MTERTLRDELERLQVETRGLEAELQAEHAPAFLEKRTALMAALDVARRKVEALEAQLATLTADEGQVRARVTALEVQLRAAEQRKLDALPLLLIGALVALALYAWPGGVPFFAVGVACTALLGVLFGPRLLDWMTPGGARGTLPADPDRLARMLAFLAGFFGLLPLGLTVFVLVMTANQVDSVWDALIEPGAHGILTMASHAFSGTAVLLALGVLRRAGADVQRRKNAPTVTAGLAAACLGLTTLTWLPDLVTLIRLAPNVQRGEVLALLGALAPLFPFGLAAYARVRDWRARRAPLALPFSTTLVGAAVALVELRVLETPVNVAQVSATWIAVELGLLGAVLGADVPKGTARWVAVISGLGVAAMSIARWFW